MAGRMITYAHDLTIVVQNKEVSKMSRIILFWFSCLCFGVVSLSDSFAQREEPVKIGLTAEYGLNNSRSAQAVEFGIRVALKEINDRGGVLGGRPIILETRDDRSVPARAVQNLKDLAALPNMVAVFGARFSPVILEMLPVAHEMGILLMDPWGSADEITENKYIPNLSFRLSLKDRYAMPFLLDEAAKRGFSRVGLLVPNTGWGRSNFRSAEDYVNRQANIRISRTRWYN